MWGFGDEEGDGEGRKSDEFFELKSSQLWRKLPTLNTEVGTLDLFFLFQSRECNAHQKIPVDFIVYDMFSIILQLGEELEVAVNACCVLVVCAVGNFLYPVILGIC